MYWGGMILFSVIQGSILIGFVVSTLTNAKADEADDEQVVAAAQQAEANVAAEHNRQHQAAENPPEPAEN